jgi:hypothetical protein
MVAYALCGMQGQMHVHLQKEPKRIHAPHLRPPASPSNRVTE